MEDVWNLRGVACLRERAGSSGRGGWWYGYLRVGTEDRAGAQRCIADPDTRGLRQTGLPLPAHGHAKAAEPSPTLNAPMPGEQQVTMSSRASQ